MRRRIAPLVLVALLAGCGVPVDEAPRRVQVPPGPFPTPEISGATAPAGRVEETLCFVHDDRLDCVVRRVDALPDVQVHLQHLLAGPADTERGGGLTSALPGTVTVAGVGLTGTLAHVQETGDEAGRSDEVLAFGQIVCTLAARGDVDAVSFRRDGQPLDVPRANGSLSRQPLTAADYLPLVAAR